MRSPFSFLRLASLVLLFVSTLLLGWAVWQAVPLQLAHAIDPVEELQGQIDELAKLKKLSEDATKPLEQQVGGLEAQINRARNNIALAKKQAAELAKSIDVRENELGAQYQLLAKRITEEYKRSRVASPLVVILNAADASKLTRDLAYREAIRLQDKKLIEATGQDIAQLEQDKAKLESDQKRLAALEIQLDDQADFFRAEIAKARTYQQELSGKIATLNAQQQSIINARSGTFTTSVGDVPLADDFNASIGFKGQAPSNLNR